jgi:hypothetical protein
MSDRQPLLNISKRASFDHDDDNGDNKQASPKKYDRNNNKFQEKYDEFTIFHRWFRMRQWFSKKKNDNAEPSNKRKPVSVSQLVSVFKRNIF